jgi:hypothetical protein
MLQILLVGQPELQAKMDLPELRQLSQRIGIRCTIPPLTPAATRNYIRTRLRLAGARDPGLFTGDALTRIAEYAEGIPRIINTLCDHCLLIGYADQTRRIDRAIADQAVGYLEAGRRPLPRRGTRSRRGRVPVLRWSLVGTAAGVLVGGLSLLFLHPDVWWSAVDASVASVSNLAESARALLGR